MWFTTQKRGHLEWVTMIVQNKHNFLPTKIVFY